MPHTGGGTTILQPGGLNQGLNALFQRFGTPQMRDEREAQRQAEEQAVRDREILAGGIVEDPQIQSTDGFFQEGGKTTGLSAEQQTGLDQISQLEPNFGASLGQALAQGDQAQLAEIRQDFLEDGQLATEIRAMPTHSEKVKAISAKSQKDIAEGRATPESTGRSLELLNLPPEELDIQLQKMEVISNAVAQATPVTPSFLDTPEKRAAFARTALRDPAAANALIAGEKALQARVPKAGEGVTLSPGQVRFDAQGRPIAAVPVETKERKILKGADDINRFVDTGEPVFPEVSKAKADRKTAKDANDVLRFLDTGEEVFPGVEVTPEFQKPEFKTFTNPDGTETTLNINNAEGAQQAQEIVSAGGTIAAKQKEIKPAQRLAAGFALRLEQSSTVIDEIGDQFTTALQTGFLPSALQSADRQRLTQAKSNYLNAVLRRESGAAISQQEFTSGDIQYFPQVGDSLEVLAQKKQNRDTVTAALKLEAGDAFSELEATLPKTTVAVNGIDTQIGTIITNSRGQQGRVEQDGSITLIETNTALRSGGGRGRGAAL